MQKERINAFKEYKKDVLSNKFPSKKNIISIFPGSRASEIDVLMPILLDFIKLMNKNYQDFIYFKGLIPFHDTWSL